jgi:dihydroflavonol-4-reductase
MIVAVTGANGVVGSAIVDRLARENYTVKKIVRPETDVLDMVGLVKAIEGVDAVVHSAGFVSFNPRNKRRLFDVNVQGTRNVVNACLTNKIKKLVHISSVAALGRHRNNTSINEETRWIQGMPVSDYAHSKYLSELEVYRGMEEGLEVSVVNPSVVLAAGDGKRSSSQLFGYVWRERKLYSDFILNYVDARDVAEIVVRLLHGNHNGEKFIASGGNIPLKNVLQEIARRFQKRAPSINVPAGLANTAAVLEEFRSAITGSEPTISRQSVRILREGLIFENAKAKRVLGIEFQSLEKTLDWCCEEYRSVNINK